MKCCAFLAAAVLAVSGAAAQNTTRPPCIDLDFTGTTQANKINSLNSIIDLAMMSGMLADGLKQVDPLTITDKTLGPNDFSVLDMDFQIVPTIKQLHVTGISTVIPNHVNVTGPTGLNVSAWFNGTLDVTADLSVEITQKNHQWWQICWTNVLKPIECPSKTVDVTVGLSLTNPSVLGEILIPMKGCTPGVKPAVCKDVSVTELLIAANSQDFSTVGPRILHRLVSVSLADFELSFDHMNSLNFVFDKSTQLLKSIATKLYAFTATEINKHQLSYNMFVSTVDDMVKQLVNMEFQQQVDPKCGATCYDS